MKRNGNIFCFIMIVVTVSCFNQDLQSGASKQELFTRSNKKYFSKSITEKYLNNGIVMELEKVTNGSYIYRYLNSDSVKYRVFIPKIEYGETIGLTTVFNVDSTKKVVHFLNDNGEGSFIKLSSVFLLDSNSVTLNPSEIFQDTLDIKWKNTNGNEFTHFSISVNAPYISFKSGDNIAIYSQKIISNVCLK